MRLRNRARHGGVRPRGERGRERSLRRGDDPLRPEEFRPARNDKEARRVSEGAYDCVGRDNDAGPRVFLSAAAYLTPGCLWTAVCSRVFPQDAYLFWKPTSKSPTHVKLSGAALTAVAAIAANARSRAHASIYSAARPRPVCVADLAVRVAFNEIQRAPNLAPTEGSLIFFHGVLTT